MKFAFFRSKKKNERVTAAHLKSGAQGEEYAARLLKKAHYKIIERNFRTPIGEIDIVARDGECLVFVEVRTRRSIAYGLPQETIDARKRERLHKAARWYLQKHRLDDVPCRFDVVAVVRTDENTEPDAEIIKDAFRPEKNY
jgi:putative endonuclease